MSEAPRTESTYTWRDFLALPDGDRRELVDGAFIEIEMPTYLHEHIVAVLIFHLYGWARANGGSVVGSGYKVRIADDRGVMPDVQFFRREQLGKIPSAGMEDGRPDLAVEVVSETSRRYDRVKKLAWYASIGVPEYWIVDGESRTLERLVLQGHQYVIAEALDGDQMFRPGSFAGLAIPLVELWSPPAD